MGNPTTKELEQTFERYCDRCLRLAVSEYLKRADYEELEKLKERIQTFLDNDELMSVLAESADEREAER
jgi:ubiquinone/menaquinone biosynthesis C-methylase UbiE